MISFLQLPRELRDRVYDECFIAAKPINLQNLSPSPRSALSQRLCLVPNLLASCRQIHEEGLIKLYGENLYFVDLTSSWRFSRSLQWHKCYVLQAEQLDVCLACQRKSLHDQTPDATPLSEAWNPNLSRVRRLQVSLQQYTYSEWKYRQPSAFPRIPQGCPHMSYVALQPQLRLSLLIIRTLERSLLSVEDSRRPTCWQSVSQRYNVRDIEQWKFEGEEDLSRLVEDVLQFATETADHIVVSGSGHTPWVFARAAMTPRYILDFLETGRYLGSEVPDIAKVPFDKGNFKGPCRVQERIITVARMSGSKAVSLHGEDVAFTSIYGSLLNSQ